MSDFWPTQVAGAYCSGDIPLETACGKDPALTIDVEMARQHIVQGGDVTVAIDYVLERGSMSPRTEASLRKCLGNIANGLCGNYPLR